MTHAKTGLDWSKLSTSIPDNELSSINDAVYDLGAIIAELEKGLDDFSTHSMNDMALYLQGAKDMLSEVLLYLNRCK